VLFSPKKTFYVKISSAFSTKLGSWKFFLYKNDTSYSLAKALYYIHKF
jgi:hypothetical protein